MGIIIKQLCDVQMGEVGVCIHINGKQTHQSPSGKWLPCPPSQQRLAVFHQFTKVKGTYMLGKIRFPEKRQTDTINSLLTWDFWIHNMSN